LADEHRASSVLRRYVFERANGCCEYCLSQALFSTESFALEHIHPRALGGTTTLDNLALSCSGCNGHKGRKTHGVDPQSGQNIALFHPRRQAWSDHFMWSDDFALVIGITPCGRATVTALNVNRKPLINLRRILLLGGFHPPKHL
jgi:hypothetical protein